MRKTLHSFPPGNEIYKRNIHTILYNNNLLLFIEDLLTNLVPVQSQVYVENSFTIFHQEKEFKFKIEIKQLTELLFVETP